MLVDVIPMDERDFVADVCYSSLIPIHPYILYVLART